MLETARRQHGLTSFRRAMAYVRPHHRPLIIGLALALVVAVTYTVNISSVVPVLKVLFAEHETIADWLYRFEAQRRLGIVIPGDLPDDAHGLLLADVRDGSPSAGVLHIGDRIVALEDQPLSSITITRRLALCDGRRLSRVQIVDAAGQARDVTLQLHARRQWYELAYRVADLLPAGRTPHDRQRTLWVIMGFVVGVALLGAVSRFINEALVAAAVQRAMHDLRTAMANHTLRLPVQWHAVQPAGDTLSRFANDISKVEVGLTTLFGKVIREPLKAAGVLSLALALDWRMLVIGVVGLPIGGLVIRRFGRIVKRAQRRASESWGRLLDHLGERLAGIRVVKACNMQAAEGRRFETEDRELTGAQTHIEYVDAASNPVLEMLATLAIALFILYGGMRVFGGQLDPQMLLGAVICLGGIFDPLRKMGNVNNRLQAAEASARRLFEVLDLPVEEPVTAAAPLPPFGERIEFRGLSFSYPSNPERRVLDDIDLEVRKGQVVALVGPNGSGKTTLMSLLLRFFEPTAGRILVDGRDIAGVALASLRRQIGLVTQEAIIFSDSVRANIAYGANGVPDEDVQRAAHLAHVDDFVRDLRVEHDGHVTTGYDARISAATLSGGQRQRIVLARAILRDPPILILDEATSQVDSESERKIQEALEDVTRNRTTFIIAHRFSTIARADVTVVLNEGRIVARGRHEELLRTCPFYDTLVKTQFAHGAA
jgi:ABC-type multidrug transport system fused ATPase/permease subunit